MAVTGDLDSSEDKTVHRCGLTTSEFVCTTEQRDRSREKLEKAIDLAYTTLMHVQLCSHAHLIMWLAHCTLCKQQLAADCNTYAVSQKLAAWIPRGISTCGAIFPSFTSVLQSTLKGKS